MITSATTTITGNFIKRLLTEKGQTEFSFLRKTTPLSDKYFILAMDNSLKAHWFGMEKRGGKWVIINATKVPAWIYNMEDKVSELICLNNLS